MHDEHDHDHILLSNFMCPYILFQLLVHFFSESGTRRDTDDGHHWNVENGIPTLPLRCADPLAAVLPNAVELRILTRRAERHASRP